MDENTIIEGKIIPVDEKKETKKEEKKPKKESLRHRIGRRLMSDEPLISKKTLAWIGGGFTLLGAGGYMAWKFLFDKDGGDDLPELPPLEDDYDDGEAPFNDVESND